MKMKGGEYMKKKLLLSIAVVTLAGASYFGTQNAFAQSSDQEGTSSLVQKISTKFGLNQSDVQAIFDEHKSEKHAKMQERFETQLTQAVTDGKITEEQKTKILAKFSEQKAEREANQEEFKNMTPEERKAAHAQKHAELKAWAEANGIDLEVLTGAFGRGGKMGKHMMR
jgi:apolipoprotein N-acyltransferase